MTAHDPDFMPARPLNRQDVKTLLLASLGGALEFYDFVIFVYFTVVISKLFFPADMPDWLSQLQSFGIFAAGYLARPLGGIVMAHFGDMMGRKRMFTLSVFLMAIPTLLVGLLPTYETLGYGAPLLLLAMRILQGAAIGGEVPGAWVFVSEHVPYKHVGMACGMLTGGLTSGILLGSLAATAVTVNFSPAEIHDFAWRIPFLLGGLLGLLAVYLRSYLRETPVFEEISRMAKLAEGLPVGTVLRQHKSAVTMSVIITWMLTAAIVVMILMTPTLLTKLYGIPQPKVLQANSLATLGLSVSCLLVGMASDRFGPAKVLLVGAAGLAASALGLYAAAASSPDLILPLYGITGFCVGLIAVVPVVMVRAFPAQVRFSGISLSYNLSYAVFGGITPLVVPLMNQISPLAPPLYVVIALAAGTLVVAGWSRRGEPEE
ncbi:MAG TPA: MFS transporter [Candidatus Sulfotelmatobacter sp.]|nr:MFS transporter [Candidatus Sulfotelmatobacter sp.]